MEFRREHGIWGGGRAILVAIGFVYFPPHVGCAARRRVAAPPPAVTSDAGWTAPVWTGGEDNAQRHWEKHGAEFPQFTSEQAYVAGVHAFLMHPPAGTLIKHRPNGDTLYFEPASGHFAVA